MAAKRVLLFAELVQSAIQAVVVDQLPGAAEQIVERGGDISMFGDATPRDVQFFHRRNMPAVPPKTYPPRMGFSARYRLSDLPPSEPRRARPTSPRRVFFSLTDELRNSGELDSRTLYCYDHLQGSFSLALW